MQKKNVDIDEAMRMHEAGLSLADVEVVSGTSEEPTTQPVKQAKGVDQKESLNILGGYAPRSFGEYCSKLTVDVTALVVIIIIIAVAVSVVVKVFWHGVSKAIAVWFKQGKVE